MGLTLEEFLSGAGVIAPEFLDSNRFVFVLDFCRVDRRFESEDDEDGVGYGFERSGRPQDENR